MVAWQVPNAGAAEEKREDPQCETWAPREDGSPLPYAEST
jgi:hypothetical protein